MKILDQEKILHFGTGKFLVTWKLFSVHLYCFLYSIKYIILNMHLVKQETQTIKTYISPTSHSSLEMPSQFYVLPFQSPCTYKQVSQVP